MNLRWNTDGLDRVARDVTGNIVIRIKPRWLGEGVHWVVGPANAPIASGRTYNITEAKRLAMTAFAKKFA